MKKLKSFIAEANEAFPENTGKAVRVVKDRLAEVAEEAPKTHRVMECDLIEEGIKHLLDQERSKQKMGIKHAHVPTNTTTPSVMKFTPAAANPPSNAIGRASIKQKILDRWMIGKGANRKPLGDCVYGDFQDAIGIEEGIISGHDKVITFYRAVAKRLKGKPRTKARSAWTEADLLKKEAGIWEDTSNDAA